MPGTVCDDRLSANFRISEFAVSSSHPDLVVPVPVDYRLNIARLAAEILQPIRDRYVIGVHITSGYRSHALNRAVGGAPTSQHCRAEAADFYVKHRPTLERMFWDMVAGDFRLRAGQVIFYPDQSFIHVALPSRRHPQTATYVHWPAKGHRYKRVTGAIVLEGILGHQRPSRG